MDVLDPQRVATAGWIMKRYSEYLRVGDHVTLGMEDDPCFRSTDARPSARVVAIDRDADGTVRFRASLDDSGEIVHRTNTGVGRDEIWEIHPDAVATFRGRVSGGAEDEIQDRLRRIEYRGTTTEGDLAQAVHKLAIDMVRVFRGEAPTFSEQFVEKADSRHADATRHGDAHEDARYGDAHEGGADERHEEAHDTRHDFDDDDKYQGARKPDADDRHSRGGGDENEPVLGDVQAGPLSDA